VFEVGFLHFRDRQCATITCQVIQNAARLIGMFDAKVLGSNSSFAVLHIFGTNLGHEQAFSLFNWCIGCGPRIGSRFQPSQRKFRCLFVGLALDSPT
jgi:hypothetical protein